MVLPSAFVLPFTMKSLSEHGIFAGYASVFDVIDQQGDRLAAGAFKKSLDQWKKRKSLPKMLWQHNQAQANRDMAKSI